MFIAGAISGVGVCFTRQLPPLYRAEALILVDPQKIPERFVASTVNTEALDRLVAISQEIQSGTRLKKIIDDFDLYPNERKSRTPEELVERMRSDIAIDLKGLAGSRPGAFRISYQGGNPFVVAQVVDRLTNLYIEENLRSREVQAEGTSDFIQNQLRDAKKTLDEQERALAEYKLRHTGELPQQENSLNASLSRLQLELQGNQDALNRAQQSKVMQESAISMAEAALGSLRRPPAADLDGQPAAAVPEPAPVAANPPARAKQSDAVEAQIAAAKLRGYSEEHPEMRRLRGMLAVARKTEAQEDAQETVPVPAPAAPVHAAPPVRANAAPRDPHAAERARAEEHLNDIKLQLSASAREISARTTERERILRDIASYQRRIEQLPVRDLEMASLTRNFEFSRGYYNTLLGKRSEAEMANDLEKRQQSETFRILDAARPPTRPFKPRRWVYYSVSLFMGLAVGLAAAVGSELKRGVFLGEWELPAGVTILSRVPQITPSFETRSPEQPSGGKRSRAGTMRRSVVLRMGFISLVGVLAAAYYLVSHRL